VVVDLFARLRAGTIGSGTAHQRSPREPVAVEATGSEAVVGVIDSDVDDHPESAVMRDAETNGGSGAESTGAHAGPATAGDEPAAEVRLEADPALTGFEQRDADLGQLTVMSARKAKRALADEQNDVLDALRRSDPVTTLDSLLPPASEHADRYTSVLVDELLIAAQAGAASVVTAASQPLRPAAGREAVHDAASAFVGSVIDPLRDRLARCIDEGGGDNSVITKKVRSVYREWKTQRIDEVLDDAVRAAHSRGLLAAVDADCPLEWVADPSSATCSECHDNQLAGAVAAGQEFPTGHVCTPAHPGCRCLLVPVSR
jgi:hypothetical protein